MLEHNSTGNRSSKSKPSWALNNEKLEAWK